MRTAEVNRLGRFVLISDASIEAPFVFEDRELQAPMIIRSTLLLCRGGSSSMDLPIRERLVKKNQQYLIRSASATCGFCVGDASTTLHECRFTNTSAYKSVGKLEIGRAEAIARRLPY